MEKTKSLYHGYRFPAAVISCAVRCFGAQVLVRGSVARCFLNAPERINDRAVGLRP
jgi:hypothetical protein